MATHTALWRNFLLAVRGNPAAKHLDIEGGSVNYRLLDDTVAYVLDPSPENLRVLLSHFENMERTGHMALSGPKGVACEQGAPGAHGKYNRAAICALLVHAHKNNHLDLVAHCERVLLDECGLYLPYRYKGRTILPCPRTKDDEGKRDKSGNEKIQSPIDINRDRFLDLATGAKTKAQIRAGKAFWSDDKGNMDVILMSEMIESGTWNKLLIERAKDAKYPRLYLSIHKRDRFLAFTGDRTEEISEGFEAWFVDTPEARRACGRDACHFVHCGPDGVWWRYDWAEPGENGENNHYEADRTSKVDIPDRKKTITGKAPTRKHPPATRPAERPAKRLEARTDRTDEPANPRQVKRKRDRKTTVQ